MIVGNGGAREITLMIRMAALVCTVKGYTKLVWISVGRGPSADFYVSL